MIDNYKYVILDGSRYYNEYAYQINPYLNRISPNVANVMYMQIMRTFFDRININISQVQYPPKCDDVFMAYGLIISDEVKKELCTVITNYYFAIVPSLLDELSKRLLLSKGMLENHIFLDHESPQSFILLMRVN